MDKKIVEEKVNNMLRNKSIDKRFIPFVHVFFQIYNRRYSLTEEELNHLLKNYSDNVNSTLFTNMKSREIKLDAKGQTMLMDTELKNEVLPENIESLIQNSMEQQAIAVLSAGDAQYNPKLYAFYEYNEKNDLNISNLLNMVKTVIGKGAPQLFNIDSKDKRSSIEASRYIRDAMQCFDDIKENKEVTPEICKRIYGFCVIALMYKNDEKVLNDFEIKRCIVELQENMKIIQKRYSIDEKSLEYINMQENGNWNFPAKDRLKEIVREVNLTEAEYKKIAQDISNEREEDKKLHVNKERMVEIINNVEEPIELTEDFISNKVSELVKNKQYIPELETIIFEFFKRSAIVYNWDVEEFTKKLTNFSNNVSDFEISDKNDEKSGEFSFLEKNIKLSKHTLFTLATGRKRSSEDVLETLFHEMRHATDYTTRNSRCYEYGMKIKDDEYEKDEIDFLNEQFVEGGTQLITGERYSDELKTSLIFDGYSCFSNILGMLSPAVGLSDKELLKLGEKGLPKFLDTLKKDVPSLKENLEKLQPEYGALMKIYEIGRLPLRKIKTKVLSRIYQISQEMYNERIKNNPPETEEERNKAEYEQYKIKKNMYNMCRAYGVNSKLLQELTGMNLKDLKKKTNLTREQRTKFLNLVSEQDIYKFNNKKLYKPVRKSIREIYIRTASNKKIKQGNKALPQGKVESDREKFLKSNQVQIEPINPKQNVKASPSYEKSYEDRSDL